MSAATSTILAIGTIAATASVAAGTAYAANQTSNAAEHGADVTSTASQHAADLQSKAAADSLAFSKQQAENDFKNQELARRANYDLNAAREQRVSSFGQMLGLPARNIPGYVPSQDPNYLANGTPAVSPTLGGAAQPPQGAPAPMPAPTSDPQAFFNQLTGGKPLDQKGLLALAPQLAAAGIQVTPPSAAGIQSKIILPDGTAVRVLNGDTSVASPTVWIPQPGTGGSAAAPTSAAVRPMGTAAAYVPTNIAPALQAPTFAGMLR